MRVAIFDFDGTLYKKETFQLLMDHLKNHPTYHKNYNRFFLSLLPIYISYKLKLYPESKMKERSMQLYISAFGDITKEDLTSFFNEIAERMKNDFNHHVLSRLKQHVQDDVFTMLVSGAYTTLLKSVTRDNMFDTIIGTDIPLKEKMIDRSQSIYHIQGKRKNDYILDKLKDKKIDWENSFAYADSYSDLPVINLVGNPVAVQPEKRLLSIAKERNWEII